MDIYCKIGANIDFCGLFVTFEAKLGHLMQYRDSLQVGQSDCLIEMYHLTGQLLS